MTDLERLVVLARRTRQALERVAQQRNWQSNLGGWCKDASVLVFRRARGAGIQAEIGHALGHWFVLLGDTVVDITSTQFGHPDPVAVLPLAEARQVGQWWNLVERYGEDVGMWDNSLAMSERREFERAALADLVGLARTARAAFERVAEKDDWPSNLSGLCYEASSFLRRMAAAHGIKTDLGKGFGHWFVLLGDTVVDITSTQFGHPDRVAVLSLEEAEKHGEWWELRERLTDLEGQHTPWRQTAELADKEFRALSDSVQAEMKL
jgi:hypothetical protein